MNETHHHDQHYALDENDTLVEINQANRTNRYRCPHCQDEMICKQGKVRQWHFAHKSNTDSCSYDRYLHSLAEIMIMDWFNSSERITLKYKAPVICSHKEDCGYNSECEFCQHSEEKDFNLKKAFGSCEREYRFAKGDNYYIADLFCHNLKMPERPLFFEIHVTHKCDDDKIQSGIRIIEIHIKSEEDIQAVISSGEIQESEGFVTYHSFNPRAEIRDYSGSMTLQTFILYESRRAFINLCPCHEYSQNRRGIYNITLPYYKDITLFPLSGGVYPVCMAKARQDGYRTQCCQFCKYYGDATFGSSICKVYKKCGTNMYCKDNDGSACSYFRLDPMRYHLLLESFENYCQDHFVDVWKR